MASIPRMNPSSVSVMPDRFRFIPRAPCRAEAGSFAPSDRTKAVKCCLETRAGLIVGRHIILSMESWSPSLPT